MNQTTIAGKSSFVSFMYDKRRGEDKIDPQRVEVTSQLKGKALRTMYPACLLQLGWQPQLQA